MPVGVTRASATSVQNDESLGVQVCSGMLFAGTIRPHESPSENDGSSCKTTTQLKQQQLNNNAFGAA